MAFLPRSMSKTMRTLSIEQLERRDLLANTYVVNQLMDDGAPGTLTFAINKLNADPTYDHIAFNFPFNSNPVISLGSALPEISAQNITIDGTDLTLDGGQQAEPRVLLDGPGQNSLATGLVWKGAQNSTGSFTLKNIRIRAFGLDAVRIASLSANDVVKVQDSVVFENRGSGISMQAVPSGSAGSFTIENNYIYSNSGGISIGGTTPASAPAQSSITNNKIGKNAALSFFGNETFGISLGTGVQSVQVLNNQIYTSNGNGVILAGTAGSAIRISGTLNNNKIRADLTGQPGAGIPIDLRGDNALELNDPSDVDTGPNNGQNKPVILANMINYNGSAWTVPIDVSSFQLAGSPQYRFDVYVQSVNGEWQLIHQTANLTLTTNQPPINLILLNSQAVANNRIAVVAVGVQGLNTDCTSEFSDAVNLIDAVYPKIEDVRLSGVQSNGAAWARVDFSFAGAVANGKQLASVPTQGVNNIKIYFGNEQIYKKTGNSSPAVIQSTAAEGNSLLEVRQTIRNSDGSVTNRPVLANSFSFDFDSGQQQWLGVWTFPTDFSNANALVDGKYALHLKVAGGGQTGLSDAAGNGLNVDWKRTDNGTPDDISDDVHVPFPLNIGDETPGATNNEFRFHFALLAGDYNGDHVIDASDVVNADGDGDGTTGDQDDTNLRDNRIGVMLPLRGTGGADFEDDEKINGADLAEWMHGWLNSSLAGDVDNDGDTDGNDFLLWQRLNSSESAWYIPPTISANLSAGALVGDFAPQVLDLIISGSISTHAPFHFTSVDGSGAQLNTVPVGGADTVSIVFSENVNVSANSLFLVGMRTGNLPTFASFTYDTAARTATWRFEGWQVLGDQYLLALSDEVTDADGNRLDGEWTNPASVTTTNSMVSTFPSGDGTPGGWFNFAMNLMPGDANLDGVVNITDYGILSAHFGQAIGQLFTDGDCDGDGGVHSNDFSLLSLNYNVNRQSLALLADFDGDWDVDDADLLVISNHAGMTGAAWADGDLNADGQVTAADLDLALIQYGELLSAVG
jgi:hypothetical protein